MAKTKHPETDRTGPTPEDNRPGHHPEHEQDKPMEAFAAKAEELSRRSRADDGLRNVAEEIGEADWPEPETEPVPFGAPSRLRIPGGVPLEALVPALALFDAATRPARIWDDVGESRNAWLARIAFVPLAGPWRYAATVKPRLEAAAAADHMRGG
jgi:hypothetical protein